jgi:hypothetical protein
LLFACAPCGARRSNSLTRMPESLALGFIPASASAAYAARTSARPFKSGQFSRLNLYPLARPKASANCCPLILDGLCLHVLSSFQRTGFESPGPAFANFPAPPLRQSNRPEGNLANLRQDCDSCQPLSGPSKVCWAGFRPTVPTDIPSCQVRRISLRRPKVTYRFRTVKFLHHDEAAGISSGPEERDKTHYKASNINGL